MNQSIERCRELLAEITPLDADCGRCCGGACCESLEGEQTGMLLFPGEAERYRMKTDWKVIPGSEGEIVVCSGRCDRNDRPLSCRLFPLLPLLRGEEIRVAMDARAKAICPLFREGVRALSPGFIEAVRTCGRILAEDPEGREMLIRLTNTHDALRQLQNEFR